MNKPSLLSDARGASRLVIDLTLLVTELVATMHHNIAHRPGIVGRVTVEPTKGLTALVYDSVRGVTRLVGAGIDTALAPLVPLLDVGAGWRGREPLIVAINGVLGDHLDASDNPLAISMQLRVGGQPLTLIPKEIAAVIPKPSGCAIVLVHGLCMSDLQWNHRSHDHGNALAGDLGANALYLRYNSGRHISTNGAAFAALLEQLVASWPVPLNELILVGHGMGGLVIRSACAAAASGGQGWTTRLRALVFIGTPHHGAPMERAGQGVDLLLAASPFTAAFTRLSRLRSAGIADLRRGSVVDRDWQGRASRADRRHPLPLPVGVPCFTIAGSLSKAPPRSGRVARSDGFVPVASALGRHADPRMNLTFARTRQAVAYGTGHLDLLSSAAVYRKLQQWLREER